MREKKLLVLATGGTIASEPGENGLQPELSAAELVRQSLHNVTGCTIHCRDILSLDSSNIQPEEWQLIARQTAEACRDYDGIVITHGTDTMAYTASALTYMLRGVPIPVVLTGSQLPLVHPLSDAPDNLRCAAAMAASGIPGVFLAFDRKVMLGCRGVKVRTSGFDAFESINYPPVARVTGAGLELHRELIPAQTGDFRLEDALCTQVFLLKLTPGLDPGIFDLLLQSNYRGVLIEAFGAGGLHYVHRDLYEKLQELRRHEIPVVVASQCLYERSDLSTYEVGKLALERGVISAQDMTSEAAFTKLMWTLARTRGVESVRRWFERSLAGEIAVKH